MIQSSVNPPLGSIVVGVDEVGRGCLAGPVLACAVAFPPQGLGPDLLESLDDSKRLSPGRRSRIAATLKGAVSYALGAASVAEIDSLNILNATMLAMARAVRRLDEPRAWVVVDGNRMPPAITHPGICLVGGDALVAEVMAASIIAKTIRDALMCALGRRYPLYGYARHAGYATADHADAIRAAGMSAHHRKSFRCPAQKVRTP